MLSCSFNVNDGLQKVLFKRLKMANGLIGVNVFCSPRSPLVCRRRANVPTPPDAENKAGSSELFLKTILDQNRGSRPLSRASNSFPSTAASSGRGEKLME